mmetsp:Transcript_9236/g.16555  ORF Transcript_9236/g.16555 Transcript_9236/m.16555 type:complete len:199 (+) Transcript_9236:75-671(+)
MLIGCHCKSPYRATYRMSSTGICMGLFFLTIKRISPFAWHAFWFTTRQEPLLDTLESTGRIEELECQQLNSRHWCKAGPDRNKASPKAQWAFILHSLDQAISHTTVYLFIGRLVHQLGANSIKGGYGARHKKTGKETGAEGCTRIFTGPSSGVYDLAFGNIIDTHLRCIQNNCSHHVDIDTTIETRNSLIMVHLSHEG